MPSKYTPFEKDLPDISQDDLATLKNVHEGWYVEYKAELITPRALAKSLSSFANQLGGWIFFGVSENRESHTAGSFPGIADSEVPAALESLKNASKDLLSPDVFYNSRVFKGPIDSLGLQSGRSIIVVQIPEGVNSPYVHNDGRIYRRIADSSAPTPETDRSRLDMLTERGKQARSRLADRVNRTPVVSKGEKNQCYLHITIMSDPYEIMGHQYSSEFSKFSEIMKQGTIPFDNIYTTSEGYIARQVGKNVPSDRLFTWDFSRRCHSFVTVPLPLLRADSSRLDLPKDSIFDEFIKKITANGLELNSVRIVDLNQVLTVLTCIVIRHRSLVAQANIRGPFYVKAHLENIWRTVPFIDLPAFLDYISNYGIPIVQDTDVLIHNGTSLDTFVVLAERDPPESESPSLNLENVEGRDVKNVNEKATDYLLDQMGDSGRISFPILRAFGLSLDMMIEDLAKLYVRYFKPQ